jgi:Na+/H+ antiporter NhaD/arsenite permease-like protein
MLKFSNNWLAISYGINAGGNGIFFFSLANLIALKFLKNKKATSNFTVIFSFIFNNKFFKFFLK